MHIFLVEYMYVFSGIQIKHAYIYFANKYIIIMRERKREREITLITF